MTLPIFTTPDTKVSSLDTKTPPPKLLKMLVVYDNIGMIPHIS